MSFSSGICSPVSTSLWAFLFDITKTTTINTVGAFVKSAIIGTASVTGTGLDLSSLYR